LLNFARGLIFSPNLAGHRLYSAKHDLLRNEKYIGDVLLQKTFVEDLFSGKQIKNTGELEKFWIKRHYPTIASRERFATAKKENRLKRFMTGRLIKNTSGIESGRVLHPEEETKQKLVSWTEMSFCFACGG